MNKLLRINSSLMIARRFISPYVRNAIVLGLFTPLAQVFASDQVLDWEDAGFRNVDIQILTPKISSHSVPLKIVINHGLTIRSQDMGWLMDNLNVIYRQCGITFSPVTVVTTDHWQEIEYWNKFNLNQKNSLEKLRSASPIQKGEVVVYFVKGYEDVKRVSGFSFAQWSNKVGVRPVLNNSVWIADYALSAEYFIENSGRYNLLAHELLHVLTLEGQHYGPTNRSLLTVSRHRTNRILKINCDLAVKNPLVQEPLPPSPTPVRTTSPTP